MKPIRKLLLIGASARAAASSVKRAGLRPLAADVFCDLDLRAMCECQRLVSYPHDAARVITGIDADAWMYLGGMENHSHVVDQLAERLDLLGNRGAVLRRVRDPWQVAAVLGNHQLAVAELAPPGVLPSAGRWIQKPVRSCGGTAVSDWEGSEMPESGIPEGGSFVFQRRVEGRVLAAVFVSDTYRAQLIGISEQLVGTPWLGACGFAYAGSIGPVPLGQDGREQFKKIGDVLAASFGLRGVFGVDAVWDGVDVWPIEVNPRYTASVEVLESSLGVSVILEHTTACRGRLPAISLPRRPQHVTGKAVLYAERDLVIRGKLIEFCQAINRENASYAFADIPPAGTPVRRGRPVLTLLERAADDRRVTARLRERAERVKGLL